MRLRLQCFTAATWGPAGQKLVLEVSTKSPHHASFAATDRQITVFTGRDESHYRLPLLPDAVLHDDVLLRER